MNKELKDKIEAETIRVAGEFIENLPKLLKERMESAVAKILGFELDTWNHQWKVDHCNGRMSTISSYINKKTEEIVKDIANEVLTEEAIRSSMLEACDGIKEDLKSCAKREYDNHVRKLVMSQARRKAEDDVAKFFEEFDVTTELELENPNCGNDPLENAIIKDMVERTIAEKANQGENNDS